RAAALAEPVLLAETLELLDVRAGGFYVDGTLGLGGHAAALLERSAPEGRLLGLDRDAETLAVAPRRLQAFGPRARLQHADFREPPRLPGEARADGILLDLGVSSLPPDSPESGVPLRADRPLHMHVDRSAGERAAEVVNRMREPELADLIYAYGEERASRRIARAIATARRRAPLRTTGELATLVRRVVRRGGRPGLDPA